MKLSLFLLLLIFPNVAMSYETAEYKVVKTISDTIEIREYDQLILATISANNKDSKNKNFRSLFKFISGENEEKQEISMTTPVFQKNTEEQKTMSFVMPNNFKITDIPTPKRKDIAIELLEKVQFIAIQFSGRATDKNFERRRKLLESKIAEIGLAVYLENPINAYYNMPWTLPFLKRNEVLFRVKE